MAEFPRIVVNYKAYETGTGELGLKLAFTIEKLGKGFVGIAPQLIDTTFISKQVSIPVFSQTADPLDRDRATGWVLPRSLAKVGVYGVLVNHSEHPMPLGRIKDVINLARDYGLKTLVCADSPRQAREIAKLGPDAIAVEPPELIGTGISVSEAEPDVVIKAVKNVHNINQGILVFVGAGIHTRHDVSQALKLGAYGVLLASGIMLSKNVEGEIKELVKGVEEGLR